jgi:hypothetical protein
LLDLSSFSEKDFIGFSLWIAKVSAVIVAVVRSLLFASIERSNLSKVGLPFLARESSNSSTAYLSVYNGFEEECILPALQQRS